MAFRVTSVLAAFGVSVCLTGAAFAEDYLVLSSTDGAITKGQAFASGALVRAAQGVTVTVMSPSGEIVRLTAGADGLRMPAAAAGARTKAVDSLQQILLRPPPSRRTFGAMRGAEPECPPTDQLTTVEAIVAADENPQCRARAAAALQALIENAPSQ
jgi:hypothetical protein